MEMVQVIDGAITQYRLPKVGQLKDGSTVSGYNLLSEETLINEGWLPLEDNAIDYDPLTHYLVPKYVIHMDKVVKEYEVKEIEKSQYQVLLEVVRDYIRLDEMINEDIAEVIILFDEFVEEGKLYKVDSKFRYKDKLYRVIQEHTSQMNWKPDAIPALPMYVSYMPENVIPEWKAPTGSHDAYDIGDRVIYKNEVWISKINANTTLPDGDVPYNRYWDKEAI